jgi:hypothetical protein
MSLANSSVQFSSPVLVAKFVRDMINALQDPDCESNLMDAKCRQSSGLSTANSGTRREVNWPANAGTVNDGCGKHANARWHVMPIAASPTFSSPSRVTPVFELGSVPRL